MSRDTDRRARGQLCSMHPRARLGLFVILGCSCGDDVSIGNTASESSSGNAPATSEATGSADTSTGTSVADSSSSSESGAPPVLYDIGTPVDAPHNPCDDVPPAWIDFSYIWIPNTAEGTVSKIDTEAMVELGRYRTSPDDAPHPALTSVNLRGDLVVANQFGGVTKIFALAEDCPDATNTSSGRDDVKPWMDGCVAWSVPNDFAGNFRTATWTTGVPDASTCKYEQADVWMTGVHGTPGVDAEFEVVLVDGDTGTIIDSRVLDELPADVYGIVGAATVDDDLWFFMQSSSWFPLVRVQYGTLDVEIVPPPVTPGGAVGFGIDDIGRVWACDHDIVRYDPALSQWSVVQNQGGQSGCGLDGKGRLWVATGEGQLHGNIVPGELNAFDTETLAKVQSYALPWALEGISFDRNGYAWTVAAEYDEVYRVDLETGAYETMTDIGGAHDYLGPFADMTGTALLVSGGFVPPG